MWKSRARCARRPAAVGRSSMTALSPSSRRRSPATLPGYTAGRAPRNKGRRYPADPPRVEETIAVMRAAGAGLRGACLRGLIVVLWRAGLRIHEALVLPEHDLDSRRGSIVVRRGKGGRRREIGMDDWGWEHVTPWLELRQSLPYGSLFCVIEARGCRPSARACCTARRARRCASALRAPCARDRTRPRGRPDQHHPAPTRPQRPRRHVRVSARHRRR